jgi:hypothetical protein
MLLQDERWKGADVSTLSCDLQWGQMLSDKLQKACGGKSEDPDLDPSDVENGAVREEWLAGIDIRQLWPTASKTAVNPG